MISADSKQHLHNQLIKLGDMMGDGLHYEPDGKWIEKEYRKILKALGYIKTKSKTKNIKNINDKMLERVKVFRCQCGSEVKQTRSGSMRTKCIDCGNRYQLLKRK